MSNNKENKNFKKNLCYRFIKRTFDIVFSILVLALGFIPSLIVCLVIFLSDGHSPIFKEKRMARMNKEIKVWKFRTMVHDSVDLEKYLSKDEIKQWKVEHKIENDPRITKIGKLLRNTRLDEFPQFIHVVTGKMSTIGPRIITKEELMYYGDKAEKLLSMRPGITGQWQTMHDIKTFYEDLSRQKVELEYIDKANIQIDIKIFFRTFKTIFKKTNE